MSLSHIVCKNPKFDLDELYEKKHAHDLATRNLYNKILNRIQNKIRTQSRLHKDFQYCWYLIPEMMIGVPKYDNGFYFYPS